jgi:hypothetical protein
MAGKGGATYEIWTLDAAEEFCSDVLKYVQTHESCYTLGRAAIECGAYEEVISYLEHKFDIEFKPIKIARGILKTRCLELGMDGKTNPTMTIFNLVNNFDMINTNTKSDLTTKGKEIKPYVIVPESVANDLLKDVQDDNAMDDGSKENK